MKIIISIFLIFVSLNISAEISVIVHPNNLTTDTMTDIKKIYLGDKKTFRNGMLAIPIDVKDQTVRNKFNKILLGKGSVQVRLHWSKLIFTGNGYPPKKVNSQYEVIDSVSKNLNAIGFIDSKYVNDTVRVIFRF